VPISSSTRCVPSRDISNPFLFGGGGWLFLFVCRLGGDLALGGQLTAALDAGQDVLAVLVELELGNDDVGGVKAQGNALAGSLLADDALDVDDVFETVDGGDLALLALLGAANDGDLVLLADGDAADIVLLSQLLAEGSAHDDTALGRGRLEVSGAALASGRRDLLVDLNHGGRVG
jgi:hypothetical protein